MVSRDEVTRRDEIETVLSRLACFRDETVSIPVLEKTEIVLCQFAHLVVPDCPDRLYERVLQPLLRDKVHGTVGAHHHRVIS